jgi:hypothetical protein
MKTSQWIIALLVLTAMVFVITFAMNYTTGTSQPQNDLPGSGDSSPYLFMDNPKHPPENEPPMEHELGQPGYEDYWFINDKDKPVTTGLNGFSCSTCSRLEVFLMPPEWKAGWSQLEPYGSSALPTRRDEWGLRDLGLLTKEMAWGSWFVEHVQALRNDPRLRELEEKAEHMDLAGNNEVVIQPGVVGKFRMHWKPNAKDHGRQTLSADLWGGKRGVIKQSLVARLINLDPLRIASADRVINVGSLSPTQLPHFRSFHVWSSTRDDFQIATAQLVKSPGESGANAVVVEKPRRLSLAECVDLERQHEALFRKGPQYGELVGHVRAAYRITLTINAKASDGTPIEIGSFRRRIEIVSGDRDTTPLHVTFEGGVSGAVRVVEGGRLDFGTVVGKKGATRTVSVRSEVKGMDLEVDQSRMPRFLKAELGSPEVRKVGTGEERTWLIEVRVLPGTTSGPFPRASEDGAVYLKLKPPVDTGSEKGYLRLAVGGVVTD